VTLKVRDAYPPAQGGIHHTQRTARLDMAVALVQNQGRSLSFELGGRSTSPLAHQTPIYRRDFRLDQCPGSVDHYKALFRTSEETSAAASFALLRSFSYLLFFASRLLNNAKSD
jgi:hypothetical protein